MILPSKRSHAVNKCVISFLTLFAFSLASLPTRADVSEVVQQEITSDNDNLAALPNIQLASSIDEDADDEYATPEGTEVSPSNSSTKKSFNGQMWLNIGLAVTAVVVAVVALCVVSNNNGSGYHNN